MMGTKRRGGKGANRRVRRRKGRGGRGGKGERKNDLTLPLSEIPGYATGCSLI